jgi:hypothetical protein
LSFDTCRKRLVVSLGPCGNRAVKPNGYSGEIG